MCKYSVLSKNQNGLVRWCHHCETYHIAYNNICMNFKETAFNRFKENLENCYSENVNKAMPNCRNILFDTPCNGMSFIFSHSEVGDFLSLIQEAFIVDFENSIIS